MFYGPTTLDPFLSSCFSKVFVFQKINFRLFSIKFVFVFVPKLSNASCTLLKYFKFIKLNLSYSVV